MATVSRNTAPDKGIPAFEAEVAAVREDLRKRAAACCEGGAIPILRSDAERLLRKLDLHEQADEAWERGPAESMRRALELLGAGPYENVDHAAERVMRIAGHLTSAAKRLLPDDPIRVKEFDEAVAAAEAAGLLSPPPTPAAAGAEVGAVVGPGVDLVSAIECLGRIVELLERLAPTEEPEHWWVRPPGHWVPYMLCEKCGTTLNVEMRPDEAKEPCPKKDPPIPRYRK